MSLDMCKLAQEIVAWLELHTVSIVAWYIPGKKNILADQLSHPDQVLPTEWSILLWVFDGICRVYGHLQTTKLPSYLSPIPDRWHGRRFLFSSVGAT